MTSQQLTVFVLKRALSMMFALIVNIPSHN